MSEQDYTVRLSDKEVQHIVLRAKLLHMLPSEYLKLLIAQDIVRSECPKSAY